MTWRINRAGSYQMAGVILKKQEKVSQKGSKYAFLQLSDPTGIFEVTLFSELLAASAVNSWSRGGRCCCA
jgi:DNA polymerase III alpha subunit